MSPTTRLILSAKPPLVAEAFHEPTSREIDGKLVATASSMIAPERRRVGLVFQDLALFPHLTVRANVAYGIRRDPDHHERADELLELVGLATESERMPHELSGGMQQRVALARALAPRPDVLLLDEPFSSLDQAMRTQLRVEVRQILREARQSAVFVTHDQGEALTVADTVAVMTRGRVLQVAPPELIYAEPATPYVATFVGVANLVPAHVVDGVAETRFGRVPLIGQGDRRPDGHSLCLLRPEHFSRVRHLGLGDRVTLSLRDIETVAFGRRRQGVTEALGTNAPPDPAGGLS